MAVKEPSESSAAPPEAASVWATGRSDDWTTLSLSILRNHGKHKIENRPVRTRGFVVVHQQPCDLRALQQACLTDSFNDCLTARYRLRPGAVFATLIRAFLADVATLRANPRAGEEATKGSVQFDPSRNWGRAISTGFLDESSGPSSPFSGPAGALDPTWLDSFLLELDSHTSKTGTRVVLFAEVEPPDQER